MIDYGKYRAVEIKDCYDNTNILAVICLNYKHSVKDFQKELYRAREQVREEIEKYGDDWSYISQVIDEKFDWYEITFDNEYVEV